MAESSTAALETAIGATTPTGASPVRHEDARRRTSYRVTRPKALGQRLLATTLLLVWLCVVGATLLSGLDYYVTPLQERPFSELHETFKPSGLIGQGLGIIGTLSMLLGVGMYSLRKRVRYLAGVGKLGTWLQLHIFLCTLGPALVLFHTSFKFGGIVSIAFWSMSIVVVSGIFGRYLYAHIPKTIQGQVRSLDSIRRQKEELVAAISSDFGLKPNAVELLFPPVRVREPRGFFHALGLAVRYDLSKRTQKRRIARLLAAVSPPSDSHGSRRIADERPVYVRDSIATLIQSQLQFEQQIVLLKPFQRLFRYWHLLHLPLAVVMLLIIGIHVAVAILFGYTWIF